MTKHKKVSKQPVPDQQEPEDLPFIPPDLHYLSERYTVTIPVSDERYVTNDRWKLRLYAEKMLERRLGDAIELTSMRVHKPHLVSKTKARLQNRQPEARLVVTIKF